MRRFIFFVFLVTTFTSKAQFISTPPTRDGVISANEYGTNNAWNDGGRTWHMAWDATNLYLAVNTNGNAGNDEFVIYMDTDPSLPVVSGTGPNDGIGGFDGVNYGRLPFSANFCAFVNNNYHQHRVNTGSSWSTNFDNNGSISKTTLGNVQEIQIAWSLMGGRPSAFNFFIYLNGNDPYGGASVYNTNNDDDQSNNKLNLTARKYFTVSNTNNGSSTAPFSQLSYTNSRAGSNTINNYGSSFYDVTLNIGGTSILNGGLLVNGHLYINDNDALNMANNAIELKGDLTRKQPIGALSNMGLISFTGTANQNQTGNISYNGGLTINKASGKLILASNGSNAGIAIDNNSTLTLTNGIIDSRTNNTLVEIKNGSSITSGGSTSFIDGNLQINNVGATAKLFPVGNTSYNPATITNTGTADNFTINVGNYITSDGTPTGVQATNQIVNRTWNVSETILGGSIAELKLQWNSNTPEEMMGFNSASCHVGHFTTGFWLGGLSGAADIGNIANALTRTRTNVTTFSPFGIASVGALPLVWNSFTAQKQQQHNLLQWHTTTEYNNIGYTIQASIDGIRFNNIGYQTAQNQANNNYVYKDYSTYNTKVYYRLAVQDRTGPISYSKIITIDFKATKLSIINTNKNVFSIKATNGKGLSIYNSQGKEIQKHSFIQPDKTLIIDLSSYATGVYYISLVDVTNRIETQKIIVQ